MTTKHSWRSQFGAAFAVPAVITDDPRLEDVSYGNDVCPSFAPAEGDGVTADIFRLWVNPEDPADREIEEQPRYMVTDASKWTDDPKSSALVFESETDAAGAVEALVKAFRDHGK